MRGLLKRVGILYHPKIAAAKAFAEELAGYLPSLNAVVWLCSAWDEEDARTQVGSTELIISVGGDGTILRAARAVAPQSIPIVGINLGRLGFMTELSIEEARDKLAALLAGEGWVDERAMLQAELAGKRTYHALNDVVLGRGTVSRVIYVETTIDGTPLTTYKADGVIIATATGSTGYSLAAGGPILYPQSREILLNPISPHLTFANALVLPPTAIVELRVRTDHQAMLSIDGQINLALESGDTIRVSLSPHAARFLRAQPPAFFYSTLMERLVSK
ncbi:MAG: NAD(+)/NADH kinase [Dehalococcoidia bacterium]|nr:MAG: NAD(+)/NADH kinase [Dehalococcoidia bacterium]